MFIHNSRNLRHDELCNRFKKIMPILLEKAGSQVPDKKQNTESPEHLQVINKHENPKKQIIMPINRLQNKMLAFLRQQSTDRIYWDAIWSHTSWVADNKTLVLTSGRPSDLIWTTRAADDSGHDEQMSHEKLRGQGNKIMSSGPRHETASSLSLDLFKICNIITTTSSPYKSNFQNWN